MTVPPQSPKIYHITHVENLPDIVAGGLLCDRAMIERGGPREAIGMSEIKRRRVEELDVRCHPGTKVGDYVPFYFCARSVMLYVIYRGNHPALAYREGEGPILHLQADLYRVIEWANATGTRWAFSLSNAGARYTEFRSVREKLDELNWLAIAANDFRQTDVKEGKQAEFLVHERFPFDLIDRIGVASVAIRSRAIAALAGARRQPPVEIRPEWYF